MLFFPVPFAVIDQAPDLPGMVSCVAGGAPDTGDAELSTSAVFIVVRAINPAPGVGAAGLHPPAVFFSIPLCQSSFCFVKRQLTQPPVSGVSFWPFNFLTQVNYS